MNTIDQDTLRSVVENVIQQLGNPPAAPANNPTNNPAGSAPTAAPSSDECCKAPGIGGKHGVFAHVCQASAAAQEAFLKL
ncbi:hypothetical protein N8314_03900, partial [Akkermansiaceae bacterium]|nr:hypothetical protein [Akkermansiaceae bacterium]